MFFSIQHSLSPHTIDEVFSNKETKSLNHSNGLLYCCSDSNVMIFISILWMVQTIPLSGLPPLEDRHNLVQNTLSSWLLLALNFNHKFTVNFRTFAVYTHSNAQIAFINAWNARFRFTCDYLNLSIKPACISNGACRFRRYTCKRWQKRRSIVFCCCENWLSSQCFTEKPNLCSSVLRWKCTYTNICWILMPKKCSVKMVHRIPPRWVNFFSSNLLCHLLNLHKLLRHNRPDCFTHSLSLWRSLISIHRRRAHLFCCYYEWRIWRN